MKQLIYIGDRNHRIAEIFKEKLNFDENLIEIFSDPSEALQKLEKNSPDLALLNKNLFSATKPAPDIFANTSLVIYSESMDVEEKLAFYRMGARRVIIEPMELIAAVTTVASIILNRYEDFHRLRQQFLNFGIMQGYSLQDILRNAFLEKKNLLIKVSNNGWDAKIRTSQGHIVRANAPDLENEDAVLKTLHLPIGKFMIRRYQKDEKITTAIPSTPAILAQWRSEQKELQEFFEKTGSQNPKFKLAAGADDQLLEPNEKHLLELISEYDTFQKIQVHSPFPFLQTLRTISDLLDRKLIQLEGSTAFFETFTEQDIQYMQENIINAGDEDGRIIVMGTPGSGKSALIRKLAGQQPENIQSIKYLDFARLQLKEELHLSLFGISIDEHFQPLFDQISQGMAAYIFLVDFQQKESHEYAKYLLMKMIQTYEVPLAVGITSIESEVDQALAKMRKVLNMPEEIPILPINPDLFQDCRELIYNLRKPSLYPEKENIYG